MTNKTLRDIRADLSARKSAAEERVEDLNADIGRLQDALTVAQRELDAVSALMEVEKTRWEQGELRLNGRFAKSPLQDAILLVLDSKAEMTRAEITDALQREEFPFDKTPARSVQATLLALRGKAKVRLVKEGVWSKTTS